LVDSDFDQMDNYSEYVAGTDPNDSNSCFRLETGLANGEAVVRFDSIQANGAGYDGVQREYALEYGPDLNSPHSPFPGVTDLPATGNLITLTNSIPIGQAFFQGKVQLVPND
jgi:hypothetical protein